MTIIKSLLTCLLIATGCFFISCSQSSSQKQTDNSKTANAETDTCDDPDANINCCFRNMPEKLTVKMNIANENEPGEKIVLKGTVLKADGKTPYSNVVMYAYHTDNTGHYSKKGNETGFQKWHGYLHGWCKTDDAGHYEINSIRPARYPGNTIPAHIHAALKLPDGSEPFYINDFVFKDDSLVNQVYITSLKGIGGSGVVAVTKSTDGKWSGERNIVTKQ